MKLGRMAPALAVSDWVRGPAVQLQQLRGRVILIEFFQVNCPGCFLYSLPQAIDIYQRYAELGLQVLGVATAFEDFSVNTPQNLRRLLENDELVGETLRALSESGDTQHGRWRYRIPFPVAMDRLIKTELPITERDVNRFIREKLPDFQHQPPQNQQMIKQRVFDHLQALEFHAETFERFQLKGTPSQVLIDKQGVVRVSQFGAYPNLESDIRQMLAE